MENEMNQAEWETLYEFADIVKQIAKHCVPSKTVDGREIYQRLDELDKKLLELPVKDE